MEWDKVASDLLGTQESAEMYIDRKELDIDGNTLIDEILSLSVECCPNCGTWVECCELIPDESKVTDPDMYDEPDGFCTNCR